MRAWIWWLTVIIGTLFILGRCGGADDTSEPASTPTVTATATVTATPTPVVSTVPTVPDYCRRLPDDAKEIDDAVSSYEQYTGLVQGVIDLLGEAIAKDSIHLRNQAQEDLWSYQSQSTAALQRLVEAQDRLQQDNDLCEKALNQ